MGIFYYLFLRSPNPNKYSILLEIVEKIIKIPIDNTTVIETGFKLWHVLLAMVVGGGFVLYIIYKKKKEDSQKR